jgi:gliding motility-associated-like protein
MKAICNLILILFFSICSFSQTFTGGGGTIVDGLGTMVIPPSAIDTLRVPVTVSGVGIINAAKGLQNVCVKITHTYVADLVVYLQSPDGLRIKLTENNGEDGANFTNTCFSMTATNPIWMITTAMAPFTGNFVPEYPLGLVNNGQNADGVWKLCIYDAWKDDVGTLDNFSITFSTTPAPPVTCNGNPLPSNQCNAATPICNLNGYCGFTDFMYEANYWPELENALIACGGGTNGSIDNNSFIKFVASATTVTLNVDVFNSLNGDGIQMIAFEGNCGSGPVTLKGCQFQMPPGTNTFTATGLTPGNTYYLMIDGFLTDECSYVITAATGVNVLNITPQSPTICLGGTGVVLTASGGNGTYTWSPATGLSTTTGATVTANPTVQTVYTVTSGAIGSLNCPLTKTDTVRIAPPPTVTAPTTLCVANTATLSPTTGGTWVSSNPAIATVTNGGVATGVSVGNVTFTYTATASGCSSTTNSVSVTAGGTVPTFNSIAPICAGATAPVLPTSSTNTTPITGTWSPATVSNLATGTYTFTPAAGQCASTATITVTVNPVVRPIVTCGTASSTSVTFDWAALAGATSYTISYTINGGAAINGGSTNLLTFTVSGLTANDIVVMTVTPVGTGCLAASLPSTCIASACPTPSVTLSSAAGTNNQIRCNNSAISPITYVIGGSATGAVVTGLPPGVTGSFLGGVFTISGTPTITGTFNYTVTTTGSCTTNVSAAGTITSTAALTTTITCGTSSASSVQMNWTTVTGATSYNVSYTINGGAVVNVGNVLTTNYTVTGLSAGNIIIMTVTPVGAAGCFGTTVSGPCVATACTLVPTFTPIPSFCTGEIAPILPAVSLNGITGTWLPSIVSNTSTGTYLFLPSVGQCAVPTTMTITVKPLPIVNFGPDLTLCEGVLQTLDATNPLATYTWQNGTTNPTFNVTQAGSYSCTVVMNGCVAADTVNYQFELLPIIDLGPDKGFCQGISLILDPKVDTTITGYTYLWQDGSTAPKFTVTQPGLYYVDVALNCPPKRDSILVIDGVCKVFIPTGFTPNNDGVNDVFKIGGAETVKDFTMQIYDRWGRKVFTSTDALKGWDGRFNGTPAQTGTYVYYIKFKDILTSTESKMKGTIMIVR